jgi:hypothetical protein
MTHLVRPRLSRRAFLKLSALGAAGWGMAPALSAPAGPRIAATLRVPFEHQFFPNPEALLAKPPVGYDLLLVPAYVAAGLIRRGRLVPLSGPRGRAHDPEGAYTMPYRYAASAVVQRTGAALADPWDAGVAWPSFSRLLVGAALQRRGYSPNDAHAGHLAQAGRDLAALRPALTDDPLRALDVGTAIAAMATVPLTETGTFDLDEGLAAALPPWGGVLVEYDWVIPLNAPDPEAARSFVQALPPLLAAPPLPDGVRLVPLTPLTERAQAQHTRLWAEVAHLRRQAGS